MRALPASLSALATALALAALPAMPQRAEASTGVIRCEMPDGTRVYTNQGCGAMGARSAPIAADLANRIASERRLETRLQAERTGVDPDVALAALDADSMVASIAPAPRSAASGCARTPEQLALDLQASVAVGDVNRVAESFDWAGMQNRQAQRVMDQLSGMTDRTIVGAEYFNATIGMDAPSAADAGVMQVTFGGKGGHVIDDFEVRQNSGCYFLRYA